MQALETTLSDMLGTGFGVGVANPQDPPVGLWPIERKAMARATKPRLAEFAGGRRAARRAMADIGFPDVAIAHGQDRAPVWPDDIKGSISHSTMHCLAAATSRTDVLSLGIDIEPADDLDPELQAVVCTPEERDWLSRLPEAARDLQAKALFCAKEAVYKAQYPLTKSVIGFDAVTLRFDKSGKFKIVFLTEMPEPLPKFGQIKTVNGMLLSVVVCESAPSRSPNEI